MPIPSVSETLRDLMGKLDSLRDLAFEADDEIKRRSIEEASATADYELAFATAFLSASGSVRERECVAKRDCIGLFRSMHTATALRRSATAASSTLHRDYEALTAFAHVWNRELRAGA